MYDKNAIRTNLISWLKNQASLSFVFDQSIGKSRVRENIVPSVNPSFPIWSQSMRDVIKRAQNDDVSFKNLKSCLMFGKWHELTNNAHDTVIDKIDATLADWGYTDFEFLGNGGRAYAFRTTYILSGERRVLRVEAPHARMVHDRPALTTLAHVHHLAKGNDFQGIKIEICDEFVPLNKLPDVKNNFARTCSDKSFFHDIAGLSRGTNMMYPCKLFDFDSDPQNVGLNADGKIIAFDPVLFTGDKAMECHRHFKTPLFLRDASSVQLNLVYGCFPPSQYHKGPQ